ncbi:MAG: helix-turn-helix transcriptional regulator [Solirubrobacterales bacterium]|nr:helix-turn-helix transcriptional regulator [Solirubrobacterales bacterium]
MEPGHELERGREALGAGSWLAAAELLTRSDRESPLGAADLELLATAAYMLGRDDEYRSTLERAHHAHLEAAETEPAVRCAFWLGLALLLQGQTAPATGWFARAERIFEGEGIDSVERGYLLIPGLLQRSAAGDHDGARAIAWQAAAIGARFGDRDLQALVVQEQGHALVRLGRAEEGLRLVDEVMLAVTSGDLSPIVTGLVYCNTIAFCQSVYELRRAREWTDALSRWCEQQPDMVAHTGVCLVHRAEILQLRGAWEEALEEARRAGERFTLGNYDAQADARARYRQGEVHRLKGDFALAEEAYREASSGGWEPQPGLALLRLAEGDGAAAVASIRRVIGETADPLERAGLIAARVEIMIAIGKAGDARGDCAELERTAEHQGSWVLGAMSCQARGAVELDADEAAEALVSLRRAWRMWRQLEAPYEAARVRELIGLACRELDDNDGAAMELEAARAAFETLGARPDLARVEALPGAAEPEAHGLTAREREVLRLVADGRTNKAIAAELVLSERTIDRHVSNIFAKVGVSSRASATAFAYEHDLV